MLPHFEKVLLKWDQSFQVRPLRVPKFTTPWHFHPEFELMWIEESRGQRMVGNRVEAFGADDLVLIGSNVPHLWLNEETRTGWKKARATVVKFRPDFLGSTFFSVPELSSIQKLLQQSSRGLVFTGDIRPVTRQLHLLPQKKGMRALMELLNILDLLAASPRRSLAVKAYTPSLDHAMEARVGKIYAFLMARFRERLTLPEISRYAAMTPAAFSRFFKRVSRRNVSVFLNDLRIDYASRQIIETSRGITEIAFDSGFVTLSSFNRRFYERVGHSPRNYRKTFQNALKKAER